MKTYYSIHEAYLKVLDDVKNNCDYVSAPRGLAIREKVDYSFRIFNPKSEPIVTNDTERNLKIQEYTEKEFDLYNSGTNLVKDFAAASKFWQKIANPDGTVNSAYGHLIWHKKSHGDVKFHDEMLSPWEWAVQSLVNDKDTRQAVMRFSLPEHFWVGNKDQVCTLHGNWLIRDGWLNLTIVMRSNDVVLGLVYDLPWFVSLMDKMLVELKPYYPDLRKGLYTHTVHSLHMYERDFDIVDRMLCQKK